MQHQSHESAVKQRLPAEHAFKQLIHQSIVSAVEEGLWNIIIKMYVEEVSLFN